MFERTDQSPETARYLPPLVLAFVGDAVYELDVRTRSIAQAVGKIEALHRTTVRHVQATAQAAAVRGLLPCLSDAEADVFRRAKNTRPLRVPKSASLADYRFSTGIEAVIGYLHLSGQTERLAWLLDELWLAVERTTTVGEE